MKEEDILEVIKHLEIRLEPRLDVGTGENRGHSLKLYFRNSDKQRITISEQEVDL